jgi:hypothetical protein
MHFEEYAFGSIKIDGTTYEHDIVIDHGKMTKRQKKQSKKYREGFGHTPLSLEEKIPWKCHRLVIGTGMHSAMPVMEEVKLEAGRRKVELLILPTAEAIEELKAGIDKTNAILHITC